MSHRTVSTGLRFTTIPPTSSSSSSLSSNHPPPSPPTTLTLLYNPLIGFLSSAYSAQLSPTIALSTRFGVNIYSYESDLTLGGEWFIGQRRGKQETGSESVPIIEEERVGREDAFSESTLHSEFVEDTRVERELDSPIPLTKPFESRSKPQSHSVDVVQKDDDRDGVIKARLSGNWVSLSLHLESYHAHESQCVGLLYEARIRQCLVSVGINSDLLNRQRPIKSIGLEVQYFS